MISRVTQALVIIFVAFLLLFHAPVVEVFNHLILIFGIPSLLFYFLVLWLALILCTWLVIRKSKDKGHGS